MPIINNPMLHELEPFVAKTRLEKSWRGTVRNGLRKQRGFDLHDYADIHYNLDAFINELRTSILNGTYRPREPDAIRTEKGGGFKRYMIIPAPADALLLQSIVDSIESKVLRAKPSKRAFYSRSHAKPDIEQLNSKVTYPWWERWREFTETIYEFRRRHNFIVITDIANYFDNIDVPILKSKLADINGVNTPETCLITYILDGIKAASFYGFNDNRSIPQIDFDAPRLLANLYLYEIDKYLRKETRDTFVRWMDDIDFVAPSKERAAELIGHLDRLMQGLHVRLNSGKTKVLTKKEAEKHFWIQENLRINKCKDRINKWKDKRHTKSWGKAVVSIEKAARRFFKSTRTESKRVGNWAKVAKRYFGCLAFCKSPAIEDQACILLMTHSSLRTNIIGYIRSLGYSRQRLLVLRRLLTAQATLDDSCCCEVAEVICQWRIPINKDTTPGINAAINVLKNKKRLAPFTVICAAMISAKYKTPSALGKLIVDTESTWLPSPWASRQVAALSPLMDATNRSAIRVKLLKQGRQDVIRVFASLSRMRSLPSLPRNFRHYLIQPGHDVYGYSLQRYIILMEVLNGKLPLKAKKSIYLDVIKHLIDPVYISRLSAVASSQGI